ncbi:hypothetical protein CAOG_02432 [Capsaspora owczarzaki ATCC 30864]|uniref:hypothetical protein n=1 Tax=Capsaspora owczarzaki (strain ATCC 30864) TaxID=595528 RepID=UPI0003525D10|nr:hypothetical protein CAOG_02432 [Capsaspora owczarzaki ATCC 30864]|eukprot:XP_004349182.2 hypothetical protein CAOG_02432 [Capsaspora owczarzaki ATCC 30864]
MSQQPSVSAQAAAIAAGIAARLNSQLKPAAPPAAAATAAPPLLRPADARGPPPPPLASQQQQQQHQQQSAPTSQEIEINDVPNRHTLLKKGGRIAEIAAACNASITPKGRYIAPEERSHTTDRPLYLVVQAGTEDAVNHAMAKLREAIADLSQPRDSRGPRRGPPPLDPTGGGPANFPRPPSSYQSHSIPERPPPHGMHGHHRAPPLGPPPPLAPPPGYGAAPAADTTVVHVGIQYPKPGFPFREKLLGPNESFINHIRTRTSATITATGLSEFEAGNYSVPLTFVIRHQDPANVKQARDLCESLANTVRNEHQAFTPAVDPYYQHMYQQQQQYAQYPPYSFQQPHGQHAYGYPPPPNPYGYYQQPPAPDAAGYTGYPPQQYSQYPPPPPPPAASTAPPVPSPATEATSTGGLGPVLGPERPPAPPSTPVTAAAAAAAASTSASASAPAQSASLLAALEKRIDPAPPVDPPRRKFAEQGVRQRPKADEFFDAPVVDPIQAASAPSRWNEDEPQSRKHRRDEDIPPAPVSYSRFAAAGSSSSSSSSSSTSAHQHDQRDERDSKRARLDNEQQPSQSNPASSSSASRPFWAAPAPSGSTGSPFDVLASATAPRSGRDSAAAPPAEETAEERYRRVRAELGMN